MASRPALKGGGKSGSWLAGRVRAVLGWTIVAGAAVLAVAAAAVVALAVAVVAAVIAALGALLYAFARLRRPAPAPASNGASSSASGGPRTLEARRTATGWTVDALGRFG